MDEFEARRILGFMAGATLSEYDLKRAWKSAAMRLHPDLGGSSEEFIRASRAAAVLRPLVGMAPSPQVRNPLAAPSGLMLPGPSLPAPRWLDPDYAARQRELEEAYGHLGDWGRSGDGLHDLWVRLYGRRRKG